MSWYKLRVGIAGASGKMGGAITRLASADARFQLAPALARDSIPEFIKGTDVIIDFTRPETTIAILEELQKSPKPFVSGTTGFTPEQREKLEAAAAKIPLLWSANMSLGVNLLAILVEKAAAALGEKFDVEILEMHHRSKVDSPSGTALILGEAAAKGRKASLTEKKVIARDGARKSGDIGFAVLRGGDVVGEHSVIFAGSGERLEFFHQATNRDIFAKGALSAALWLANKPAGLYSMANVLNQ